MPPLEAWPAPGQHLPYTTFLSSRVSVADRRSRYPNHTGTPVDSTQSKGKGFSKSTRTIHRGCPGWTHLHQPASGSPGPGRPLKKKVQGNDQESRSTGCRTNGGSRGAPSSPPQPLDGTSHTTQLHVTPGTGFLDLATSGLDPAGLQHPVHPDARTANQGACWRAWGRTFGSMSWGSESCRGRLGDWFAG